MDIVVWLRSLGLGKYEAAFRENEIDETVLPNLTAEDLKELGVSALGHIGASCSTLSPPCVLMPARKHHQPASKLRERRLGRRLNSKNRRPLASADMSQ